METLQKIALVVTIIGAVNWGLVGLFDFNLVTTISGDMDTLRNVIYIVFGITGLINIGILFSHFAEEKELIKG